MFRANNKSELLKALRETEISVPRRSGGRTKSHVERYSIAKLLSALVGRNHFSYPLSLIRRERPDFLLTMDATRIGIEHTEAISQNAAKKQVLREKGIGPELSFLSHHQPGERKKSAKELIEEIKANNPGTGWAGDSVEREWAEAMSHSIERKAVTLMKAGFERFDDDWLLIYDNWSLPALERHKAAQFLSDLVTENKTLEKFGRIFVITGKFVCEIYDSGGLLYDISNL